MTKRNYRERDPLTKVCWSRPGQVIQLVDSHLQMDPTLWLVCIDPKYPKGREEPTQSARTSNGLYSEPRELWLADLVTGQRRAMPHLSSRCFIREDVEFGSANLPPPHKWVTLKPAKQEKLKMELPVDYTNWRLVPPKMTEAMAKAAIQGGNDYEVYEKAVASVEQPAFVTDSVEFAQLQTFLTTNFPEHRADGGGLAAWALEVLQVYQIERNEKKREERLKTEPTEYGHVYVISEDGSGKRLSTLSTTSDDPSGDAHRISGFLELERAVRLRDVDYEPHPVGSVYLVPKKRYEVSITKEKGLLINGKAPPPSPSGNEHATVTDTVGQTIADFMDEFSEDQNRGTNIDWHDSENLHMLAGRVVTAVFGYPHLPHLNETLSDEIDYLLKNLKDESAEEHALGLVLNLLSSVGLHPVAETIQRQFVLRRKYLDGSVRK